MRGLNILILMIQRKSDLKHKTCSSDPFQSEKWYLCGWILNHSNYKSGFFFPPVSRLWTTATIYFLYRELKYFECSVSKPVFSLESCWNLIYLTRARNSIKVWSWDQLIKEHLNYISFAHPFENNFLNLNQSAQVFCMYICVNVHGLCFAIGLLCGHTVHKDQTTQDCF